jgi:hypothetical protein
MKNLIKIFMCPDPPPIPKPTRPPDEEDDGDE